MSLMVIQAALLFLATFSLFALIGWRMGAKPQVRRGGFDSVPAEVIMTDGPVLRQAELAPVADNAAPVTDTLVDAVNVVPFRRPEPETTEHSPPPTAAYTELKAAASNIHIDRSVTGLQGKISTLASMTPESVEAAVMQAGSGLEPLRLSEPRGPVDDLKIISGVGPVNEKELHELGIYHYWQIASWSPENVAWVSGRIRFPKRIVRENWMSQAAKLSHRV
jgi:predicted flap endonuclease-1-like 5' DNA nuclease